MVGDFYPETEVTSTSISFDLKEYWKLPSSTISSKLRILIALKYLLSDKFCLSHLQICPSHTTEYFLKGDIKSFEGKKGVQPYGKIMDLGEKMGK